MDIPSCSSIDSRIVAYKKKLQEVSTDLSKIDLVGKKYFSKVIDGKIKLYDADEYLANGHDSDGESMGFECYPVDSYYIYRQANKQGMLQENYRDYSLSLLVQDNETKMTWVKLKLTLDFETGSDYPLEAAEKYKKYLSWV